MNDTLTYQGLIGSVHFSPDDDVFYGKIEEINDLVTFEGHTPEGLIKAFQEAVDDYISLCVESAKEPERPFAGRNQVFPRNLVFQGSR
ncbi:MAG: type II toxin-antitoxin system HicB family antitoxin [bacterium]|nr:type II toxin-antitoxin system HicB family antitoxin [bacterium]